MVVQRTLNKIEELKDRPHHERRAVAKTIALSTVAVLVLFWGFFQVRSVGNFAMKLNAPNGVEVAAQSGAAQGSANAASAAAATQSGTPAAPSGYTASSTNGKVEIVPLR